MADLQEVLNTINEKVPENPIQKILAVDTNIALTAIAEFADQKEDVSFKDQPGGYAGLDGSGKIPLSALPYIEIDITDGQPITIAYGTGKRPQVTEINYDSSGNGTPNTTPNWTYNKISGELVLFPAATITDFTIN